MPPQTSQSNNNSGNNANINNMQQIGAEYFMQNEIDQNLLETLQNNGQISEEMLIQIAMQASMQ